MYPYVTFEKENIMNIKNQEENKIQAKKAFDQLKESVYFALLDLGNERSTTDISHNLNFTTNEDVQIVKSFLNKFKSDGLVDKYDGVDNIWKVTNNEG